MVEAARAHLPKLRALAAYADGALGPRARAVLERHLAGCGVCRDALTGLRRAAVLAAEARAEPGPDLDWARIEAGLAREAARRDRARRAVRYGVPLTLAVAACAALMLTRALRTTDTGGERVIAVAPPAESPKADVRARELSVHVTAVVGEVHAVDATGVRIAVGLDTVLREGWKVETGAGAELHAALEGEAALLLEPDSELRLASIREDRVELGLARGRVVQQVRPRAPNARYAVSAAGYEVEVRGTHFAVELRGGIAVGVDEGVVAVLREDALLAELRAPERWSERGGTSAAAMAAAGSAREPLRAPRSPVEVGFERWPALDVPSWPRVVAWEIDGSRLGAGGDLRMRVPPGSLDLAAWLEDGRRMRARIEVDALGSRFDPRALRFATRPAADASASPDPAQAMSVIRAAQPDLQRCYERSLRQQPGGALKARLRLELDARGRVRRVDLAADRPAPALLRECIQGVAQRWRFAAPGGDGITFEAPIAFRPRN